MDAPGQTAEEALQGLLTISVTFLVLCTVFVALRFVARLGVKAAEIGLDDVFIVLGYVVCIALCADGILIRNIEVQGNPPADLPILEPSVLVPTLKSIYAAEQLLYAGTALPKLSLLFLYLRIFDGRNIRITTWILIAVTVITWITWSFIALFLCRPVSFYWDRLIPHGECTNINHFWRSIPPFNIATDLVTMILPLPTIWRLEASRMKRVGVIGIFLTGGVGLITACIRWSVYLNYSALEIVPNVTEPMLGWAIIEACMYLIAACLPMLRPIFVKLTPSWLADKWTRDGTSAYHPSTTGNSHRRWSAPFRRSKDPSAFFRLGDREAAVGGDAGGLPLNPESKTRTSVAATTTSPVSPVSADIPLRQLDGIHKQVDVTVTQARVSGSLSSTEEEEIRAIGHGRTMSMAEQGRAV